MALFKMLSMRAQDCEKFADLDAMIDSRKIAHLDKLAKIIYSKLKGQNVFLETSEKELARWSGKHFRNPNLGAEGCIHLDANPYF